MIADLTSTSLLGRDAAEAYRERGQEAVLVLPLLIGGRHAGVMQLSDARAPRPFTGADVAFAEFMARQAARVLAGDENWPSGAPPRAASIPTFAMPSVLGKVSEPPTGVKTWATSNSSSERPMLAKRSIACAIR